MKTEDKRLSLLECVYLYVMEFCGIEADHIFQGGVNSATLPQKDNNFAVINIINDVSVGTNTHEYTDTAVMVTSSFKAAVQLDVYGNSLKEAQSNMLPLHSLFRDDIACDFFIPKGYSPLYADEIKVMHVVDASNQYVPRLTATFYFTYKDSIEKPCATFSNAAVDVANVDVKFKP